MFVSFESIDLEIKQSKFIDVPKIEFLKESRTVQQSGNKIIQNKHVLVLKLNNFNYVPMFMILLIRLRKKQLLNFFFACNFSDRGQLKVIFLF